MLTRDKKQWQATIISWLPVSFLLHVKHSNGISQRCLVLVKLELWGYHMLKKLWLYVKPFRYNTKTWHTDGRTDRVAVLTRDKICETLRPGAPLLLRCAWLYNCYVFWTVGHFLVGRCVAAEFDRWPVDCGGGSSLLQLLTVIITRSRRITHRRQITAGNYRWWRKPRYQWCTSVVRDRANA